MSNLFLTNLYGSDNATMTCKDMSNLFDRIEKMSDKKAFELALEVIAAAMSNYEKSKDIVLLYDGNKETYLKDKARACDLLDDASDALVIAQVVFKSHKKLPPMFSSLHNMIKTYEGCVLITSFVGKRSSALERDSSTYLIKNPETGLVKIGKSVSVSERVKALQCGAGVVLELLGIINENIESKLHKKFADKNVFNEWFDDSDGAILEYFAKRESQN